MSKDASGDGPFATFTVPARVVTIKRASEVAFGVCGLLMIAVFFPWNGPPVPASIAHIGWPMLALGVAAPAAFIWLRCKRIPPGVVGGTPCAGPDGIEYRAGPDHVRLGWAQIAAVHPIRRPPDKRVRAIWLPGEDPSIPNATGMTPLEIACLKNPYRPVERPDGVLPPLRIFSTDKATADTMLDVLSRSHARAAAAIQRNAANGI